MVLVDTSDWQIFSFGKQLNTCMYAIWDLVTCTYLTTQKIRLSYARYGVSINQIKLSHNQVSNVVQSFASRISQCSKMVPRSSRSTRLLLDIVC